MPKKFKIKIKSGLVGFREREKKFVQQKMKVAHGDVIRNSDPEQGDDDNAFVGVC